MKKLQLLAFLLVIVIAAQGQRFVPIPIPIQLSGGSQETKSIYMIATYLSVTISCLIWLVVRFLVVRKSKYFVRQSAVRNFFYELIEYENIRDHYLLNMAALILLCVQVLAFVVGLSLLIQKYLD